MSGRKYCSLLNTISLKANAASFALFLKRSTNLSHEILPLSSKALQAALSSPYFIVLYRESLVDELWEGLAETIVKERPDEYYIHGELVKIAIEMLGKGYVCSFHSRVDPEIDPKLCKICIETFG